MEFETIRLEIDDVDTVVKAIGSGPAVLGLHGAATIEGHEWARGLSDRFRIFFRFILASVKAGLHHTFAGCKI